ncbi:sigma 54-interacting transcriptional regulator [Polyangium jinanense]|uniref:Sigma-54-dependent Fis family transcriptional regulator n=1 Tax=Polyangium jinanense TaxID=2829994 RepID=A0A9X3WZV4_9BACT|nr:sigma-54 dependent transcriptional regulator [Polyangium jinanense]MDC3955176.1 sigma-54-dependent Fis family transcriptional regulator [Polyangium jinanense]MDC3981477.1 sigma-54-dependent Fis family transcriptional regulator [Polyangium jinanense]
MPPGRNTGFNRTTLVGRGTATASGDDAPALALTILYHPVLERVGDRVLIDDSPGRPFALSRAEPVFAPPSTPGEGEPLGDEHLSRKPIHFTAAPDGGLRIDVGDSSTALNLRGQRLLGSAMLSAKELARGVVLELGHRIVLLAHHAGTSEYVLDGGADDDARELAGASDGLRRVLWDIRSIADLDLPVLLRGETGSGKELVARAIHRASLRRDKPFVPVNLGAIPPSLAVAELFGAEKGAYTGAEKRRVGYFEQAHGGTLFLDEIGEAPVELQVALLRTLETGEIQTVGSTQLRKTDVRVVAATDADLEGKVATGSFRAPLLNRLAAYEIWIPPLRDRRDDIGRLLVRFLREELTEIGESHRLALPAGDAKPWLPASLVARLAEYDWPGNVRQLRNVVRQLVIGNRGRNRAEMTPAVERLLVRQPPREAENPRPIEPALPDPPQVHVPDPPPAAAKAPNDDSSSASRLPARRRPADVTEAELRETLRMCRWDLAATAEKLGISRASLYLLIERFPGFRTAGDLTEQEIAQCHRELGGDLPRMAERLEVSERALLRRVRELGLT